MKPLSGDSGTSVCQLLPGSVIGSELSDAVRANRVVGYPRIAISVNGNAGWAFETAAGEQRSVELACCERGARSAIDEDSDTVALGVGYHGSAGGVGALSSPADLPVRWLFTNMRLGAGPIAQSAN